MRAAILPLAFAALATPALSDNHVGARVTGDIQNRDGEIIGSISAFETASGIVRVSVQATGLTPGPHAIHFHETGECVGDFTSAGGHIAGGMEHGLVEGGPHPGDMPNALVQDEQVLAVEVFNSRISVEEHLRDSDGAAFIIHEGADDYTSQPSGDAGSRVACAVLNLEPM
ncbi:Superoxide dismutase [Cu-Zn] precursor [Jannaschia seosinensis]|uniref:Superoxide dismutase [Cu-Zn] n=1 Tax=Jannaschia seosinensis TaxID=313367 RepID=A0A0M7B607_9RHOB|nr:superoxide dismutase family protein [Jannaschia seosinensis]CUH28562.1 Superoxide dismutase [Cu-Zn] precursor [Jannaschia seosinensis]